MLVSRFPIFLFLLVSLSFLWTGCQKEKRSPLLTTSTPFFNDDLALVAGATFYSEGDAPITEKGICWSETSKTPDLNASHKAAGKGPGSFTLALSNVKSETTYYVRAYATNKYGTTYGTAETINSGAANTLAQVRSINPSAISINSLAASGFIESEISQIREVGFCWTETGIPDINGPHITATLTSALFTGSITGLKANTSYTIRPYAKTRVGISYGEIMPIKTYYGIMTDQSGNNYYTIMIGDQIWTAENLRTTRFRDGQQISNIADSYNWSINASPAYCFAAGQPTNSRNGFYYNFAAASDPRIAPLGWHVPTQLEFTTLINNLGGNQFAGAQLKTAESGYWTDSQNRTNPSGFNALPLGYRAYYGTYVANETGAYFVSVSYLSLSQVFSLELNQTEGASMKLWDGRSGFSVRLVQD